MDDTRWFRLVAAVFFVNLVGAQLLHEAGHWTVLQLMGHQPVWSVTGLVQIWDRPPRVPDDWVAFTDPDGAQGWLRMRSVPTSSWAWAAFLAAGPLAQAGAILVGLFAVARARRPLVRTLGWLIAVVNAFGSTLYQLSSVARGIGGDEALLGHYLGVRASTIAWPLATVAVAGLVVAMRYLPTIHSRLRWAGALIVGAAVPGPAFMWGNQVVIAGVDAGNPWYRPLLGISFPVAALGMVGLGGIAIVMYRWKLRVPLRNRFA